MGSEVPPAWSEVRLDEFLSIQRGHDLPKRVRRPGGVPVIGASGRVGWHDESIVVGPSFTIGRAASIGSLVWEDEDFWPLNTTLYVTDAHGNDLRFAYYLLHTVDFHQYNSGSVQPMLNRNFVAGHRLVVPPVDEQRAIAEVLGALDDRIEWCDTAKGKLHSFGAALLASTLADEGLSAVRPLPPERMEVLGSWASVLESGSRPRGGVKGINGGVPSVGAESITRVGDFDHSKTKFVPREFFERMRRGHVADMDVLVYKDGGKPGVFIPHVSLAGSGFPFDEFAINDHVYRVRVRSPYTQSFLYFWLSTPQSTEEMAKRGTGAAQPGLSQSNFKQVPLPTLSASTLAQLNEPLVATIRSILHLAHEQAVLAATRDALLPRLLLGELRIEDPARVLGAVA